jgi:NAD(P)-dependent dehydrogenase (short-subunit alcohol dehydrogenase family)
VSEQVVLISGAGGGIGAAVAARFAAGGWKVAITDVDSDRLEKVSAQVGDAVVATIPADIRGPDACRQAVEDAAAATGRLDSLICAAGVWTEGPADETREEDWDLVIDVNLKGLFFLAASAIPHLEKAGGSITNVSSDAGIQGNGGAAVYCASKGGVSNLTKALALELAPRGVRVNAVCPGDVSTPMLNYQADAFGGGDPGGYRRSLLASYPQKEKARFIEPEEVAELIWFLTQPPAAPVTGANVPIDFGLSAGI